MAEEKTIEERAASMGWSPKEKFRGDPERFVDAETFVRKADEMMPILRANNKKLEAEVSGLRGELTEAKGLMQASSESIEELKKFNTDIARNNAKAQKQTMLEAIKQAKKDGDVDAEVELTDQLTSHNAAMATAEASAKTKPNGDARTGHNEPDWTQNPEWKAWIAENPWFGKDSRRTNLAVVVGADLRRQGLQGRAMLDKVAEEVEATLGNGDRRNGVSKVEGDRGEGKGGGGGDETKSYSNLPADARAACEHQAKRLVGKGRAFENIEAWRKHYTNKYFEE